MKSSPIKTYPQICTQVKTRLWQQDFMISVTFSERSSVPNFSSKLLTIEIALHNISMNFFKKTYCMHFWLHFFFDIFGQLSEAAWNSPLGPRNHDFAVVC